MQVQKASTADSKDNVLKNAPHTAGAIASDDWSHAYSREQAAFPLPFVRADEHYWPSVGRIDNPYGDRNLMCSCPPVAELSLEHASSAELRFVRGSNAIIAAS